MAEDKKESMRTEHCSYCGKEISLPNGFVPNDVDIVRAEKFDEQTGSFVVIKTVALLACNLCHHGFFKTRRSRKSKR